MVRRGAVAPDWHRPGRGDDFDPVDDATHPLDLGHDGLRDLLEVVGGKVAAEVDDALAGVALDISQGQIAAPSESGFGLPPDLLMTRRGGMS